MVRATRWFTRAQAKALRGAGKPHQLITLDSEDHWLSNSVTRIRMLHEIEKFLVAHLSARR